MSDAVEPLFIASGTKGPEITAEVAGSKAVGLWRMARLGLPVPPAFVLPTALCQRVNAGDGAALEALERGLVKGIAWLEERTGRRFGDARAPLLISVRSGAAVSMPGMLQTVLNIGLDDETVHGLIRLTGNPRLAFDCWRRLIQSYAEVVGDARPDDFDRCLAAMVAAEQVEGEAELDSEAMERLALDYRELATRLDRGAPPDNPREQLSEAARAVFRSWDSPRAVEYRRLNGLHKLAGTAVTVQAMVFGNSGPRSGAGVVFSRNPATGANALYLDFLFDAQGEDVVSGRRTPVDSTRLASRLPDVAKQLADGVRRIEQEQRDAQDVEFTVDDGRLYFLQTRSAKRTPLAALSMAVAMVQEGLIDIPTALARIGTIDPSALTVSHFAEPAEAGAQAISAAPGVASGRVVFDSQRAQEWTQRGEPVILVRPDTSTEDVAGFAVAQGILTAAGGRTAHAAVVARQLGKVCLVGCRTLAIDEEHRQAMLGDAVVREGDWISLDGDAGTIALGRRSIVSCPPPEAAEVERWKQAGAGPA
ncbi:pyruvate phosphate dikinase [Enhydrobacter aerosaccus]|uniref:Pyruvate phosphate dikinase n=1 Tax=Enhydrobacter aerosaccus TaxID=225324 RepID=A0A1T4T672_9HYPH|nr:pyruvate, phosphate dikinase [Enhydrobacter aerosaccus]SKA35658.1 pyruvate phosphate dikinase [Enhydrobacter aerosaccus]